MKNNNIVKEKSYRFALRVIKAYKFLSDEKREFVLSKQMLRSGTAIGALIREAEQAQSRADFVHKMNISLKEANETVYWLMLLKDSEYIDEESFMSIHKDCDELIRLLVSIVKTTKTKNEDKK
jgi:four helix bundle protein